MEASIDDVIFYGIVGIALLLYVYIIWDIYRQNFRDEWVRTLFLALVMFIPMVGMLAYAIFSRRFIHTKHN